MGLERPLRASVGSKQSLYLGFRMGASAHSRCVLCSCCWDMPLGVLPPSRRCMSLAPSFPACSVSPIPETALLSACWVLGVATPCLTLLRLASGHVARSLWVVILTRPGEEALLTASLGSHTSAQSQDTSEGRNTSWEALQYFFLKKYSLCYFFIKPSVKMIPVPF